MILIPKEVIFPYSILLPRLSHESYCLREKRFDSNMVKKKKFHISTSNSGFLKSILKKNHYKNLAFGLNLPWTIESKSPYRKGTEFPNFCSY